jgi:hypothetical protein
VVTCLDVPLTHSDPKARIWASGYEDLQAGLFASNSFSYFVFRGESFSMPLGRNPSANVRTRAHRRGPRMNSRVPVAIEWSGKAGPLHFETGFTRVVNTYGCLLASPKEIEVQQRLRLTNLATRNSADAVVVWKGAERTDGWDVGVELIGADMDFWGVEL